MLQDDELLDAVARITPQWLAGFFDGEGCVSLYHSKQNGETIPFLKVSLVQADPKILALIALRFGGGPYVKSKIKAGSNRKTCYVLSWNFRKAEPFLTFIKDHVIIKKREVLLGLEFCSLVNKNNSTCRIDSKNFTRRGELVALASAIKSEGEA